MTRADVEYLRSLLSGLTPEELAKGMAQAYLRDELHVTVERSQLAIIREDEDAFYVGPGDAISIKGIELRVTKDDPTVERV